MHRTVLLALFVLSTFVAIAYCSPAVNDGWSEDVELLHRLFKRQVDEGLLGTLKGILPPQIYEIVVVINRFCYRIIQAITDLVNEGMGALAGK